MPAAKNPCRLELNNSGAWKVIVRFDAADEETSGEIMDAAAKLSNAVNAGADKPQFTLRISAEDATVLARYEGIDGGWRDAKTGAPL